ncbi:MAG TPA: hypothetical protein VFU90_14105 [Candidatus Tumulicola sp.]|nr:hypothetical protein [Candidatus Tumulicola sp.]
MSRISASSIARAVVLWSLTAVAVACASSSNGPQGTAEPLAARPDLTWRISTRYQVDLWLHGYALLQKDTTLIPYFKPGYRDSIIAFKKRGNITTVLDTDKDSLETQLNSDSKLVGGQFLGLYFRNWESTQKAIDSYLKSSSSEESARRMNVRQMVDPDQRAVYGIIQASYSTPAERQWLRKFSAAMQDENTKYYANWWRTQQSQRAAIFAAVDSLWAQTYFAKFRPFLTKSGQSRGEILLSLPLDGEGRTLGEPGRGPTITITFPDSVSRAVDAMYVLAHEAVSPVSNAAVNDNTTPAEKKEGVADRYTSPAAVRGGLQLLQKIAPELAIGYARYYLDAAHISYTPGAEVAAIEKAFPLRQTIAEQLTNQLNTDTSGS